MRRLRRAVQRPGFLRRLLGTTATAALVLLVLALGAVAAALAALQTDWGRERLRLTLERQLGDLFAGAVSIGPLSGSPLSGLAVAGATLKGADGQALIQLGALRLSWDPLALLEKRVHAVRIEIDRPVLRAVLRADGTLDVAVALRSDGAVPIPPPAAGAGASNGWTVALEHVQVHDGVAFLLTGTSTVPVVQFEGLEIESVVSVDGDRVEVTVGRLEGRQVESGLALVGSGRVIRTPRAVTLDGVELRASASRLAVAALEWTPDGALTARLAAQVAGQDLDRFLPGAAVAGNLTMEGTLSRTAAAAPFTALLDLRGLGGRLASRLTLDPSVPALRGELHGDDLVAPLGPPAKATFDASFDLAGASLASAQGSLLLDAHGVFRGHRVDRASLRARLAGGVVNLDLDASAPGTRATLGAALHLPHGPGVPLRVEAARLQARCADLRSFADLLPALAGSARLDARASGRLDSLSVRGNLGAEGLAAGSLRAASLRAGFDLQHLPGNPSGTARVEVLGATADGVRFGDVRLRAATASPRSFDVEVSAGSTSTTFAGTLSAQVKLGPGAWPPAVRVAPARFAVRARSLPFTGGLDELLVARGGAVTLRGLRASSAAGSVEAGGRWSGTHPQRRPARRQAGAAAGNLLDLRVVGADLARLRAALRPEAPEIAGIVDLGLSLRSPNGAPIADGTPAPALVGSVAARGLVLRPGLPPVDLTLTLTATSTAALQPDSEGGLLAAEALLRDPTGRGTLALRLRAAAPADPFDLSAWRAIDPWAPRSAATLELRDIDLALIAAAAPRLAGLKGIVAGTLALGPGAHALAIDLKAHGVGLPPVAGADLEVHGSWGPRELELAGSVGLSGQPAARLRARAGVGLRDLLAGADPRSVPLDAHVDSDDFPWKPLAALSGSDLDATGSLALIATLTGTAAAPRLTGKLALAQARIAGVAFESLTAGLEGDDRRLAVEVRARQQGGGRLDAAASLDRSDAAASRLRIQAARFDLGFLTALSQGRGSLFAGAGGMLDADVSLRPGDGTGAKPAATGTFKLAGGRFYVPSSGLLDQLELAATIEGGHVVIERLTGRSGGGSLTGTLDAQLVGLQPQAFTATLGLDAFPVLAGAVVVKVTTHARLQGAAGDGGVLEVVAVLEGTRIRVPAERRAGPGLQSVHASPDVVFTDALGNPLAPPSATGTSAGALSQKDARPDPLPGAPAAAPERSTVLRLRLLTPGSIEVAGPELALLVRQDLVVTIRRGQPTVSGGVELENGFVQLFGARWEVPSAHLSFDPRAGLDPRVDVQLTREFHATTVYVGVSGLLSQPRLSLRAAPGSYDQAQILSWVMGGSPDEPGGTDTPLGSRAVGAASGLLLGQVQEQLRALLPLDVLAVQLGEGASVQTTRIQVGKWLSDSLFLGYRARLNSADATKNQNEASIQWRLGRRWLLDAFYGDRGAGGADLLWSAKY